MDQRTMIYWAACIDSTLYLVGVFALGVWQNHHWACILAVATKGVSYLADWCGEFARDAPIWYPGWAYLVGFSIALGVLAGAMAI